ncbi:adenosine deaminase [Kitasatospora sp. NBC_01287]|uniref:adenosine deaminase n=1 Tax=Kitasatospora sp. NBC_01287 TaxID=2903573 RepID=UPI0022512FF6|nr:adenosine deaminase [Kitasatospora sp. NBC_01287]MCX4749495.1 adenosine deaminase [Kitasatospora sp. NBC_01287]
MVGDSTAAIGSVRDLRSLPKAELHLHLLAAMRPATLAELAAEAGRTAPDPRGFTSFAEFQQVFHEAYEATSARPENLQRVVAELVEDTAADGGVWVQPHFDPHSYAQFGSADHVLEMVVDAGRQAGERCGVGFGLTIAVSRHRSPEDAVRLARFAVRHAGRGVHALGLTGDEAACPAEPFAEAFAIARAAGLTSAPHAGELCGPDSVRAALDHLGATRIAHGIRAAEDPTLLDRLSGQGISLDVCLTSNRMLGIVPDLAEHPLPQLLAAGVRCSLGTDDPLMFGSSLTDEYVIARDTLGLDDRQLADIARTSLQTSDAPSELIAAATAAVDNWLRLGPGQEAWAAPIVLSS